MRLNNIWRRMREQTFLTLFLPLMQLFLLCLYLYTSDQMIDGAILVNWLGGSVLLVGSCVLLVSLPQRKLIRYGLSGVVVLLLSLLFIYEYYLITDVQVLFNDSVALQYHQLPGDGLDSRLLLSSIPTMSWLKATGWLLLLALSSYGAIWLYHYRREALRPWRLIACILLLAVPTYIVVTVRAQRDVDVRLQESYDYYRSADMVNRYIATTRGGLKTVRHAKEKLAYLRNNLPKVTLTNQVRSPHNVVVIMGESLRRLDMHCYGYPLEDTPHLDSLVQAGSLILYDDVVSCAPTTLLSLRKVFSIRDVSNPNQPWDETSTLPLAFSQAGYRTYWATNQEVAGEYMTDITVIANTSDTLASTDMLDSTVSWLWDRGPKNKKHDEQILPLLQDYKTIAMRGKENLFTLVHLMGSHIDYKDRYPEQFRVFKAQDILPIEPHLLSKEAEKSAHYINSVLYNDWIVNEIIRYYSHTSSIVIYMSDHAVTRYDDPLEPHSTAHSMTQHSLSIPFMVYMSDQFMAENPDIVKLVKGACHRPFITNLFTNSLLGLMGIQVPYSSPQIELWSAQYDVTRPREVHEWGEEITFEPKYPSQIQ